MDLELITIGTELLLGFTIDTNAAEMGRALSAVGARLVRRSSVSDDSHSIRAAVSEALARTGAVITTGGLGPTRDDVTKRVVAELFGAPLEIDDAYLAALEARWRRLGRTGPMAPSNRTQAEVPRGAVMLPNPRGTAPGLWLEGSLGYVIMLPGVPDEMRGLLTEEVLPRLRSRLEANGGGAVVTVSRVLRTTGIAESSLATVIDPLEDRLAPVTLAYLPTGTGVDLRFTAWRLPAGEAAAALERAAAMVRSALGDGCYGEGDCDLAALVLDRLRAGGLTVSVAESCTGGVLAARLTAVPGSSDVFMGGVVAYHNDVKTRDLGVPAQLLNPGGPGAVSEVVVRAMVDGVMRRFETGAGFAVTGIAGPGGGSDEKPVGTVWMAARAGEREEVVRRQFAGSRDDVRQRAAQGALNLMRRVLASAAS